MSLITIIQDFSSDIVVSSKWAVAEIAHLSEHFAYVQDNLILFGVMFMWLVQTFLYRISGNKYRLREAEDSLTQDSSGYALKS